MGKSRVAYLVRGKRVRTVAVAGPEIRSAKALRGYLSLVPTTGMKERPAFAVSRRAKALTAQNAVPLVQRHDPHRYAFYCEIGL